MLDRQTSGGIDRRFAMGAAAVFLAVTVGLLANILFAGRQRMISGPGGDLTAFILPMRTFGFDEMARGHVPQWNPYSFSGTPYVADFSAALWYPPNWLHLLINHVQAINWIVAVHLALAGWLTALWCRMRGLGASACILGGLIFEFSGSSFLQTIQGHVTVLCAVPWTVLLLLSLEGVVQTQLLRWVFWGIVAVGMSLLASHPQTTYYSLLAGGMYVLLRLPGRGLRLKVLGMAGAMVVGGCLLGAIQLFPGWMLAGESVRSAGVSYQFSTINSLTPENLLTLFNNSVFGRMANALYFGPKFQITGNRVNPFYFGRGYFSEASVFVGASTMALVVQAIAARRKRIWYLVALATVFAIMALGAYTPVHGVLYRYLPGYSHLRGTVRFTFLVDFFVAMVAAEGWQALRDGVRRRGGVVVGAMAALFLITGLLLIWDAQRGAGGKWAGILRSWQSGVIEIPRQWLTESQFITQWGRFTAIQLMLVAAILAVSAAVMLMARRWPRVTYVIAVLVALELLTNAAFSVFSGPPTLPYPAEWAAAKRLRPDERVVYAGLSNLGLERRVEDAYGYDPIVLRRYAQFLAVGQHLPYDQLDWAPRLTRIAEGFGLLRVNNIFLIQNGVPTVVQLQSQMPRLQLVPSWVLKSPEEALRIAGGSADFDPREVVMLETTPDPLPVKSGAPGSLRLLKLTTDSLEIEAYVSSPAVLLVSDVYAPGWHAVSVIPGPQERYQVLPADYILRGIPLAAGFHHILLSYTAPGLIAGAVTTVTMLGAIVAGAAVIAVRKRRNRTQRVVASHPFS